MPVCDGCGSQVDEAHIRRRIERLELATRYRPVHVQILFLEAAPPPRAEDYFYRAASDRAQRSLPARMFFDEMAKCAGFQAGAEATEQAVLEKFQHHGLLLASAVECPLEEVTEPQAILDRLAPTVLKRIQASYKPKRIAAIGQPIAELIPFLQLSGFGEKMVLNDGGPFVDPFLGDPQNQAEFGTALGDRLIRALNLSPS